MNVLAKPQLENTILLEELIDIMENLGIPDDDRNIEAGAEQVVGQAQEEMSDEMPPEQQPAQEQTKKRKGVDISSLSDESKTLLYNFLLYLEQESMTVANFFESVKYDQMVKTKKKESSVDIVSADDFFRLLNEQQEIIEDATITDQVMTELKDML